MCQKKWYALYTKVRWEKKVADLLTKRNIESYCPVNKSHRQWADRKKIVLEPLFASYVFVRGSEIEHPAMKQIDGVINLVYWLGRPAVIKDNEIEMIRQFLNDYSNVQVEKGMVNLNDRVRIVSGPLVNHEGHVIAIKTNTVKVMLPSLGFTMSAEVDRHKVERIADSFSYSNSST